jgi:hypothetical protein
MIDEVFQLVNFISDKNGRGYIPPAKFNLLAKTSQLEFLSTRLGNIKQQGPSGVPPFGYKSSRRIDVDVRPFVYGPELISINPQGNFYYPYGFMWPDAFHKNDFSEINEIDSDEYPRIKKSTIIPPTEDYPVIIFRNPYGFIDPYSIGSFQMSYVKYPRDPVWGYDVVNDEEVYSESKSQDFTLRQISLMDITALILEKVGINLDKEQLLAYAQLKQQQGT